MGHLVLVLSVATLLLLPGLLFESKLLTVVEGVQDGA